MRRFKLETQTIGFKTRRRRKLQKDSLVKNVAPYGRGQVRFQKPVLGSDAWDCIADEELLAGERVKVLSVEGTLLKVGRINKGVSA